MTDLISDILALLQCALVALPVLFVLKPVSVSPHTVRLKRLTSFLIFSPSLAKLRSSSLISFSLLEKRMRFCESCSCSLSDC